MLELNQIRSFVAVAEELHFGRAAERLNMTQPPLSRQIKLLEEQVGALLLARTSRVVRLTSAGRAFLPEAVRILRLANDAASKARRVASGEEGSLTIGFTAAIGYGVLPELVHRFHERAPGIALVLKELVTTTQLEALNSGLLDIGLLRPHVKHHGLATRLLCRESILLAVPDREAAAWPNDPTPECLQGKDFLMYSPIEARYFHQLVTRCLENSRVTPNIVDYVTQVHTMLALVSSGIGVALVPKAAARLNFQGITVRRMRVKPHAPVEAVASYRTDNDNPSLRVFRREVIDPRSFEERSVQL